MKYFDIVSFQDNADLTFQMSHEIYHLLVPAMNTYVREHGIHFGDFDTLIFSISAQKGISDFQIQESMKSQKHSTLTKFIRISDRYISHEDDYVLHLKHFDFRKKENWIRIYSVEKYIEFVLSAFDKLYPIPNFTCLSLKDSILSQISKDPQKYLYKNEEHRYLEFLASDEGKQWCNSDAGKEFAESEIGNKWFKLIDKYSFDSQGNVIFGF